MKYLLTQDIAEEPSSQIVELIRTDLAPTTGYTDRWLGLAIALVTAVICFGFIGHSLAPAPVSSATTAPTAVSASEPASVPTSRPLRHDAPAASPRLASFTLLGLATAESEGMVAMTVDGDAPSTLDPVTISVRTPSGRLLASAVAVLALDDERPGSSGGARTGRSSLHRRVVVEGPIPPEGWQLEITWRDESNGSSGSVRQLVTATGR
jgi:hypothetical protein